MSWLSPYKASASSARDGCEVSEGILWYKRISLKLKRAPKPWVQAIRQCVYNKMIEAPTCMVLQDPVQREDALVDLAGGPANP